MLWRVSGPALGWRNRLSLRSGPATSPLAQNRAKSGDSWASRAGRAVQAGSSRWTVIAARYMATCLAASGSQPAIRVRQRGSVKPRCTCCGPQGPGPRLPNSSRAGRLWARTSNRAEMAYAGGWFEALHERVQPGTRRRGCAGVVLPAAGLVFGVAGECEQALALVGIQPERIGDRGQHTGRGPGLAALLQPRVPGQADVGELSDLFPAETPGSAAPPNRPSPTSAGRSRARRERRNAPSSRRRSRTAPRAWLAC